MKIYIRAMSFNRKQAKTRIESFSKEIAANIIKLSVYQDSVDTQHWIDELANWFDSINKIELKPKNTRFNKSDLDEWIFCEFGTTRTDVEITMNAWMVKNKSTNRYPYKEITSSMVDYAYLLLAKIKDYVLNLVSVKNDKTREEIRQQISQFV